ncbi:hypothetical protein BHU72_14295 [Desulfuribacillus stibiiarsenatis]|uniref:Copper chaperone CopZ n=1 Tax=Desulfuribacillus stibiiarsenatis TaxID=1390249 RepID=A0A1E5L827_9FIRM|nr:cation transporter [Desulfuribacillus stibiiarsenatis]OEH86093.1 hypothetical protein BHU72_14295 [Desulfuribacillus stibiiarsenatis]
MKTILIKVEGMSCGHCKMSIENTLNAVEGITKAEVNLADKTATVTYTEEIIIPEDIKNLIDDLGFDAYL